MVKGPTPRQAARTENIERIKRLALSQLADSAASELSLRAIARDLNLVSSAIYRYYASRDELITALIVDAYDELGATLEHASHGGRRGARRRWTDTCHALRAWAVAAPHRFALIYGSAIPGYVAPRDTVVPAGRVVRAFCRPATEGHPLAPRRRSGRDLGTQLALSSEALELDVARETMLVLVGAFARVLGLLNLELNGHLVGGFEPADDLFHALVEREADALGL